MRFDDHTQVFRKELPCGEKKTLIIFDCLLGLTEFVWDGLPYGKKNSFPAKQERN